MCCVFDFSCEWFCLGPGKNLGTYLGDCLGSPETMKVIPGYEGHDPLVHLCGCF